MFAISTGNEFQAPLSSFELRAMESIASKGVCVREQTVHEAFQNKGGNTWRELQFLLFGMNLRMMRDGFRLGTEQAREDWALRNMIESVEQQYLTTETIPEDVATEGEFMVWRTQDPRTKARAWSPSSSASLASKCPHRRFCLIALRN